MVPTQRTSTKSPQAIALELALEAAGVDRATVVGHDFGGPIALSFYRRRPQFFTALMLLSTNSFPDTSIPFPLSMVNAPVIGRVMGRVLFSTPSLRLMLMRYGGTQLGEARSVRRIFTASLDNLAQLYGDYPGILHSVDVPASVVWGDRDPFFPVAQAERTASLLEDVKLHFLYGDRPLPARGTPRGGRERDRTPGGESDRAGWRTRI
ncbi:MAG: alpha/beta fold hydrolase [Actinomycetota bacterium]